MYSDTPMNNEANQVVHIEIATEHDVSELIRLLAVLFSIEHDFSPDTQRQRKGLEQMIEPSTRHRVMVARTHDRIVGMATAQMVISTAQGGYSAWVEDVIVDRAYRRIGIGSALIDALTLWAKASGATRMQLLCETTNHRALHFYDTNGWETTGLTCLRTLF